MPNLQGTVIHSAVTKKLKKVNLKILIDEKSGDMAIHNSRYGIDKTLILTLDEMPERYQAFFAGYVLTDR